MTIQVGTPGAAASAAQIQQLQQDLGIYPLVSTPGISTAGRVSGIALCAALGDSITQYSYLGVNVNLASYMPHGYLTWAMAYSMGSLWMPLVMTPGNATPLLNYNRGIFGETSAQTLARVQEIAALPVKPRYCFVLTGTNDLTANPSGTAAATVSNNVAICAALLLMGVTPVLGTLPPRGNGTAAGWGALSAGQITTARGKLMEINRQLRAYIGTTPGVLLQDLFYGLVDPTSATSDPVAGLTGGGTASPDYLHPNTPGAQNLGLIAWQAVASQVAGSPRQAAGAGDAWSATDNPFGSMLWDTSFGAAGGTAGAGVSSAPTWAATTAYTQGAVVITAAGRSYKCVNGGTSGSAAPAHTTGQGVDGTVTWEFLSANATAGVPSIFTANRVLGAASTAAIATQARTDGVRGNEAVLSMTASAENAQFRMYPTSGGSIIPDANFSLGDAFWFETEVEVDCQAGLMYGSPDALFKATGSAYAGTYQVGVTQNSAGVQSHAAGKFAALFRSPIIDIGLVTSVTTNTLWTLDGVRAGGTGAVVAKRRNTVIRKYNKTAPGAITW